MKDLARYLAQQGRHGDTQLMHVSPDEVAALRGLGSLTGRRVTTNPRTGLPEAFNFSSLIPAIVGIGGTVLTGGAMSPLMAGLVSGAATTAATGSWQKGLMSGISGGAMAGLGAGANEMMGAGSEAALGAQSAVPAATTGAEAGAAAFNGGQAGEGLYSSGVSGASGAGNAGIGAFNGGQAGEGFNSNGAELGAAPAPVTHAADISGMDMAADSGLGAAAPTNQATSTLQPGKQASLDEAFGGKNFTRRTIPGGLALYGSLSEAFAPGPMGPDRRNEPSDNAKREKFGKRSYTPASDPYYALGGGEPKMFSAMSYAQGGIAGLPAGAQDSGTMKAIRAIRSHYRSKKDAVNDMRVTGSFIQQLGVQDPNDPILNYAFGYTKNQGKKKQPSGMVAPVFMAGGGEVGSDAEWEKFKRDNPDWEKNQQHGTYTDKDTTPAQRDHRRYMDMPEVLGDKLEDQSTHGMYDAGQRQRLRATSSKRPRIQMAEGGGVPGGDGMSDSVPAMIDGQQPAALSQGEFVVPADAVSGLGNGSTEAGAQQLYSMVDRIRAARTGRTQQAPAINPKSVLPA